MSGEWTEERRQHARERIARVKPWERSTGPTTDEGKAISARNSLKHGLRAKPVINLQKKIHSISKDLPDILSQLKLDN